MLNIELASPDDFIPALPGWQDRSEAIGRFGPVEVFHMDFYSQALSKIQRGNDKGLADAHGPVNAGKVDLAQLQEFNKQIRSQFVRYPAIDLAELDWQLESFIKEFSNDP